MHEHFDTFSIIGLYYIHLPPSPRLASTGEVMSEPRALATLQTCVGDEDFRTDHLKLCALWYGELLFETLGEFNRDRFLEGVVGDEPKARNLIKEMGDFIIPLDARIGPDMAAGVRDSAEPGYPRWGKRGENYTYPEPETAEQFAHNTLLAHIEREHCVGRFSGHEVELAEGRARVAVNAVRLWDAVNRELPCMLQANDDERTAMVASKTFLAERGTPAIEPITLLQVAVPSLTQLSWDQVLKFRRAHALDSLRRTIAKAVEVAGESLESAKTELNAIEKDALEFIVEFARPNVRRVTFESVLSTAPGVGKLASFYFGTRNSVSELLRHEKLGWLYLLREIRSAAKESGHHSIRE